MLRAAPDGYTVLGTGDNQLIYAPLFNKSSKFDPRKDLAPITQLAVLDWALVANPAFPAKTIERAGRAREGKARRKSISPPAASAARSRSRWSC